MKKALSILLTFVMLLTTIFSVNLFPASASTADDYLNNYENWQMFWANSAEKEIPGYDSDGDGAYSSNDTGIHDKNSETTTIKADNTYGRTDTSSVLIAGFYNYYYIMLPDIKENKNYTLTFYYSGEAKKSGTEYLINAIYLFAPTVTNAALGYNTNGSLYAEGTNYGFTTPDGLYANKTGISNRTVNATAGIDTWNKVEITFNSGELTTLALALLFNGSSSDSTTCKRWIDDISLVEHDQNTDPSLWTVYNSDTPSIAGEDSTFATWVSKEYNTADSDNIYPDRAGSIHFSNAAYQKPATTFSVDNNSDYILSIKYKSPSTPITSTDNKTYHISNIAVLPAGGSPKISTSGDRGDIISLRSYNFGFINQATSNDYTYFTAIDAENPNDWYEFTLEFNSGDNSELIFFMSVGAGVSDVYICDFEVTKVSTEEPEQPELSEGAVFYEDFEDVTDPTTIIYDVLNQNWATPKLCTTDSVSGNNSVSAYAMYQNLVVPLDTSIFTDSTVYEVSMNWKLLEYTTDKNRRLSALQIAGWNPSEGNAFKNSFTSLSGSFDTINSTGEWTNSSARFKWSSNFEQYEQIVIRIYYSTSGIASTDEDTIYIDDLKITEAENIEFSPIDLNESEGTEDTVRVLAFGNSFSIDATEFIEDIAAADGTDLRVGNAWIGGCSLERHYSNMLNITEAYSLNYHNPEGNKSFSGISMQQALTATDWDYITIQQVSSNSGQPDTFEPYLKGLIAYFKEICPDAEVLFHSTWAYPDGSSLYESSTYDSDGDGVSDEAGFYAAIKETYLQISENYNYTRIIPVGEAIRRGRIAFDNDLSRDGHHCDDYGRLIAALVWYETFTGISALDATVDLANVIGTTQNLNGDDISGVAIGVTEEESLIIRTVAHESAELYKKANEAQLTIDGMGEITDDSYETILKLDTMREELGDDTFLTNLDELVAAIDTYKSLCVGDVVNDGALNLKDLVTLARLAADWDGLEYDKYALDIDGNDVTELNDVNVFAQYLAGWDVELAK